MSVATTEPRVVPTPPDSIASPPAPAAPAPWPITVEMFDEMVRRGIIADKAPVYLWKGSLAHSMAPNPPHVLVVSLCSKALERLPIAGFCVHEEKPLRFQNEQSQPEPDITLLRGGDRVYALRHPTTADAVLVIEVADTSLPLDRLFATDLASENVPTYWIVNLPDQCVEVYTDPAADTYRQKHTYLRDDRVPVLLDGREVGTIAVAEILP